MPVCPLDFRYGREELKRIFDEESKLARYLEVEAALARSLAHVGQIPKEAADEIEESVTGNKVSLDRVKEIEEEIRHDVMAVAKALSEVSGKGGKYVHYGATSYDIVDTATALQFKESLDYIRNDLIGLAEVLCNLAETHADTVMVGRTHGQHALPMTLGLKLSVFASEVERHYLRLRQALPRICVGKLSGAVGTGAALGEKALEIQAHMLMEKLGLGIELPATQIVQRDRHIELLSILANIAASVEKFATEIRNLQRTEIGELSESFDTNHQVGSSTMAQKKNPITCENVSGLARLLRAMLLPAWENSIQWHERDLANSSNERFILPHAIILCDDILVKMTDVFRNISVNMDRMKENIALTKGSIMAESVMIALVEEGMGRQEAHEMVRAGAMQARKMGVTLMDVLEKDPLVSEKLGGRLDSVMDPGAYLGKSSEIVELTVERVRSVIHEQ